ncbi:MAG: hypothetical protein RLN72_02815, partial [Henriciella sp.]
QQLDSLRTEMESNLLRIDAHRSWSYSQLQTANKLRLMLSGDLSEVDASSVDAQLLELQILRTFVPELSAYQDLTESGGLRRLNGTPLRDALARWQESLAALQRLDRDALVHRDDVRANYFLVSLSQAALVEHYAQASGKIPSSQFRNDIQALAGDVRMENFLAMRAAFGAGIPAYLNDLEEKTESVIAVLEEQEGRR